MKKYTDGYYIYQHVEFVCYFNLQNCDGCDRTMTGFVHELQTKSLQHVSVIFCKNCMGQLSIAEVN